MPIGNWKMPLQSFWLSLFIGTFFSSYVFAFPVDKSQNFHESGVQLQSLQNLGIGSESHQGEFVLPKKRRSVSSSSSSEDELPSSSSVLLKDAVAPGILHPLPAASSPEVNFYRANYYYSPRTAATAAEREDVEILQELQRLFAYSSPQQQQRALEPRPFSWDAETAPKEQRAARPWKGSNLTNGLKSLSFQQPLPFASDWNKNSDDALAEVESNSGSVGVGVGASGSHVSLRNPSSPFHDPLGNILSQPQWSFKPLYPLWNNNNNLNMDDSDNGRTAAKRNANYMCHFKLCQLGASGKRKWDPTRWYFNGAGSGGSEYDSGKSH